LSSDVFGIATENPAEECLSAYISLSKLFGGFLALDGERGEC